MVTTAVRPSEELMAVGEMTSPSSPCFSTTVPSKGAYSDIVAIVAWISWILAWVSLMDASRAATRASAFLRPATAFSYSSWVALCWPWSRVTRRFLALLLPPVGPGLIQLGPVLEQLGLARGQHRLHVVMLDDGEGIALLDLHPLVDIHSLDPARYFGADHRLRPRFQVPGGARAASTASPGVIRWTRPARYLGPRAHLVVLLVGDGPRGGEESQGDQPQQQ